MKSVLSLPLSSLECKKKKKKVNSILRGVKRFRIKKSNHTGAQTEKKTISLSLFLRAEGKENKNTNLSLNPPCVSLSTGGFFLYWFVSLFLVLLFVSLSFSLSLSLCFSHSL